MKTFNFLFAIIILSAGCNKTTYKTPAPRFQVIIQQTNLVADIASFNAAHLDPTLPMHGA
jgi:hypothetical protein